MIEFIQENSTAFFLLGGALVAIFGAIAKKTKNTYDDQAVGLLQKLIGALTPKKK